MAERIGVFEPKLAMAFGKLTKNDMRICEGIINDIEIPFFEKGVSKYGWHLMIKTALEIGDHFKHQERMPMMAVSDNDMEEIKEWFLTLPIDNYLNQ